MLIKITMKGKKFTDGHQQTEVPFTLEEDQPVKATNAQGRGPWLELPCAFRSAGPRGLVFVLVQMKSLNAEAQWDATRNQQQEDSGCPLETGQVRKARMKSLNTKSCNSAEEESLLLVPFPGFYFNWSIYYKLKKKKRRKLCSLQFAAFHGRIQCEVKRALYHWADRHLMPGQLTRTQTT